jgi:hypothetical protein
MIAMGGRRPQWLGAIAAARLSVLGPWPALRSGSACHRMPGFSRRGGC